jgi:hypothetical protein
MLWTSLAFTPIAGRRRLVEIVDRSKRRATIPRGIVKLTKFTGPYAFFRFRRENPDDPETRRWQAGPERVE